MKRISSRMVFFHKKILPVIWFVILGAVTVAMVFGNRKSGAPPAPWPFLFFPVFGSVLFFFLMKKLIFTLMDEVYDEGEFLLLRNDGEEVRIPFSAMRNVSYQNLVNPPRITISLREPCRFGREISFVPPVRFGEFFYQSNPLVEDLIERMDKAQRR
ncbi:MAG: hypothetical protein ACXWR1_16230 [Bdellovibrionota bacterium]